MRSRIYYGLAIVLPAAAAMVGTLPGRTQGLGLITEPLLRDLVALTLLMAVAMFVLPPASRRFLTWLHWPLQWHGRP